MLALIILALLPPSGATSIEPDSHHHDCTFSAEDSAEPLSNQCTTRTASFLQQSAASSRVEIRGFEKERQAVDDAPPELIRFESPHGFMEVSAGVVEKTRPEWTKAYRCRYNYEASTEECEECLAGEDDCCAYAEVDTGASDGVLCKMVSTDWDFVRLQVHFVCSNLASIVPLIFCVGHQTETQLVGDERLVRGVVRVRWDEEALQMYDLSDRSLMHDNVTEDMIANQPWGSCWSFHMPHENQDGHTIHWDLIPTGVPTADAPSLVWLSNVELSMVPAGFAECEETTQCMNILGEAGTEGQHLHSSNAAQRDCLEDASPSGVCKDWKECLERHDNLETILQALVATGAGGAPSYALVHNHKMCEPILWLNHYDADPSACMDMVLKDDRCHGKQYFNHAIPDKNCACVTDATIDCSTAATDNWEVNIYKINGGALVQKDSGSSLHIRKHKGRTIVSDDQECLDPMIEDVQAWECDCLDEVHANCDELANGDPEFSHELCLRAHFCRDDRVCCHWIAAMCEDEEVQDMIGEVNDLTGITPVDHCQAVAASSLLASNTSKAGRRQLLNRKQAQTGKDIHNIRKDFESSADTKSCG